MTTLLASVPAVNSIPQSRLDAIVLFLSRRDGDAGDDYAITDEDREACMDVWADNESTWAEDYSSYVASIVADQASPAPIKASKAAPSVDSPPPVVPISATPDVPEKVLSKHESAVADIVCLIVKGFEDEGSRNFRIGKRTYSHLQYQHGNFPQFVAKDCDRTINRITDEVRVLVAIDANSIRLMDWVKCHVLRELVVAAKGKEHAERLSFHEYRRLIGKALSFDKKAVSGSLVDGWLDYVMSVSTRREAGEQVRTEEFIEGIERHAKSLASSKAPARTVAEQAIADKAHADKVKAIADKKALANIDSDVQDALGEQGIPLAEVLATVEKAAALHGHTIPTVAAPTGKTTIADLNRIIDSLFANGQYAEMLHTRNRLSAMLDVVDRAMQAAQQNSVTMPAIETTFTAEPVANAA